MVYSHDVLLTFNCADRTKAVMLAEALEEAGLSVLNDERTASPEYAQSAPAEPRIQVLCISHAALSDSWLALERDTVLYRDPSQLTRRFIPVRFDDCNLPESLHRYRIIDLSQDWSVGVHELSLACHVSPLSEQSIVNGEGSNQIGLHNPGSLPSGITRAAKSRKFRDHVHSIVWSPDGRRLAVTTRDGLYVLGADSNLLRQKRRSKVPGSADVFHASFSPDGSLLTLAQHEQPLTVVDSNTLSKKFSVNDVPRAAVADWSPDGRFIAVGSINGSVYIVNSQTGAIVVTLAKHTATVRTVRWSPDGRCVACGSFDHTVSLWNPSSGLMQQQLLGHSSRVQTLAWSPDGQLLVSASDDRTLRVWDAASGRPLQILEGHLSSISSVSFNASGSLMASHSDRTIKLWATQSWDDVGTIATRGTGCLMTQVAFAPNDDRLAGADEDAEVLVLWKIEESKLLEGHRPPTRRYLNAKVVLVGDSGVGKTTLAHRLFFDKFDLVSSTHGMSVERLDLKLARALLADREVYLWDLAGQEDYRLIHQLFLEQTALLLLLINPQSRDPFSETEDWLKAVRAAVARRDNVREIASLLIATRIDVGSLMVSERAIEEFIRRLGISGYLPVSALRGDNCSDADDPDGQSELKRLIAANIPWDSLPFTQTPAFLLPLKSAIESIRDVAKLPLIRFPELCQRLEQEVSSETFNAHDVRTALTLLSNQGLLQQFKFGDLILLRPSILNGYAASIIKAARNHPDQIGAISEDDVYSGNIDFSGVERLPRADEDLLLRAVVQTLLENSLCIAENVPKGRQLIFPSQYRRGREMIDAPDPFVTYSFVGQVATVYSTLVVRLWYSAEFRHRELWSNAAELETLSRQRLGLVVKKENDTEDAQLTVFFSEKIGIDRKVDFLSFIESHLSVYTTSFTRERHYKCSHGHVVSDRQAVRDRLSAGKVDIACTRCDHGERVLLFDEIETLLSTGAGQTKVEDMTQTTTRKLQTSSIERLLVAHVMAVTAEANQMFIERTVHDEGIDGYIEFRNNNGRTSGRQICLQLKSGNSYLRRRKRDGREIFRVKKQAHLELWEHSPDDVYLVVRTTSEAFGQPSNRWMNITKHLKCRESKRDLNIVFEGEVLDSNAIWAARDRYLFG